MRLSIRARMILAMNLLVAAVGSVVGYAGIEVATSQVEQRLVSESATNAAELFSVRTWPLDSDGLMSQSAQLLGAETATFAPEGGKVISSSLPARSRAELEKQLAGMVSPPGRKIVTLDAKRYCVGSAMIHRPAVRPGGEQQRRLLVLLVPEQRVIKAQTRIARRIAVMTLVAILLATAIAFWLSTSIARPVRRLADRMDHLGAASEIAPYEPRRSRRTAGPVELVRLAKSFDELLARLAAARHQLDRSARLAGLGQLAASVAHELRNPLSGIKMNARVLADELESQGSTETSLDHIIREIDRMDLYLQELLSLTSDSAGAANARSPVEPVDLPEQARSVASLLSGRCEHAGVSVETSFDPAAGLVLGEAGRIRQVILNLALNALDAMPYGGTLTVAVMPADVGGAVRLEISDTGPGVQAAEGVDIFEPFISTKPQGTGLGLYICRRIIESFDGHLGYRDREKGAMFWFELPTAPEK